MENRPVIIDRNIYLGCNGLFRGSITDINIWNRPLTLQEVDVYTKGCDNSSSLQPEVLEWPNLNISFRGKNVKSTSVVRADICTRQKTGENLSEMKILGYKMDFIKANELCHLLGGEMALPAMNGTILYADIFSSLPTHCSGVFWIPILQSNTDPSLWINAHNPSNTEVVADLPWAYGQPNGKATICGSLTIP